MNYVDIILEEAEDYLYSESLVDSIKNNVKKPKISSKNAFENQLNLSFNGVKVSVDKKLSDENAGRFLNAIKKDLTALNKVYKKEIDLAVETYLLKLANTHYEMNTTSKKIKSMLKLDYIGYTPRANNTCSFNLAFNSSMHNPKFFDGQSFWIGIDFENGKKVNSEYNLQG